MGLFDKLTGARDGAPGVAPAPVDDLRAALLALGQTESFAVRDGADRHCDLVAEWGTAFERGVGEVATSGGKAEFQVRLKFHPDTHEVHFNSAQSSSSWSTGSGGQARRGYNFSSGDVTQPLRDTVTGLGWAWKAALFKL